MTTNISDFSGSAKIYTFPARGRFAASSRREVYELPAAAQLPAAVKIASSSGWYHDDAIQDAIKAERAGKN